jgi:hypothetical protein
MIACGLLSLVLVTVMTLFGQLIKNTNKNSLLSAGSFFADKVMEKQIQSAEQRLASTLPNTSFKAFDLPGYTEASGVFTLEGSDSSAIMTGDEDSRKTNYLYRLEAEQVDGFNTGDQGQLWKVDVEVRWWQDTMAGESSAKAGQGKLNLERSRLVYLGFDR